MRSFPSIKVSNGVEMPMVGLGTWQSTDDSLHRALKVAITECGYRLVDTAELYGNEKIIVLAARDALERLQLEKVDLLLAHVPTANDASNQEHDKTVTVEDIWRGLEAIYDKGLARAIGVSNFNVDQIERIMKVAIVPIHNAQNEVYLYWPQHELVETCMRHGIALTSYGTLGSPGRIEFTMPNGDSGFFHIYSLDWPAAPNVLKDPTAKNVATIHGKSPAQVLLRYEIERGTAVIPKSVNPERIRGNINIFNFALTEEDKISLCSSPHRHRVFCAQIMEGHPEDSFKEKR